MFPASIRFLFGWLSNGICRLLFNLAGIAAVINFVYTAILYSSVRSQLLNVHARIEFRAGQGQTGT